MIYTCWKCEKSHESEEYLEDLDRCPSCNAIAFIKPYDEGYLHECQDLFIQSRAQAKEEGKFEVMKDYHTGKTYTVPLGDNKYLNDMLPVLIPYVERIVYKKLNGNTAGLSNFDDSVAITVQTLIRYYKTKEDFKISTSFGTYLQNVALQPLFNKKDQERQQREISLSTKVSEDRGSSIEDILDQLSAEDVSFEDEVLDRAIYKEESINEILDVLEVMLKSMRSNRGPEEYFLLLTALKLEYDEDIHPRKRALFWDTYRYDDQGESREALFKKAKFILVEGVRQSLDGEVLDSNTKEVIKSLLQMQRSIRN